MYSSDWTNEGASEQASVQQLCLTNQIFATWIGVNKADLLSFEAAAAVLLAPYWFIVGVRASTKQTRFRHNFDSRGNCEPAQSLSRPKLHAKTTARGTCTANFGRPFCHGNQNHLLPTAVGDEEKCNKRNWPGNPNDQVLLDKAKSLWSKLQIWFECQWESFLQFPTSIGMVVKMKIFEL